MEITRLPSKNLYGSNPPGTIRSPRKGSIKDPIFEFLYRALELINYRKVSIEKPRLGIKAEGQH